MAEHETPPQEEPVSKPTLDQCLKTLGEKSVPYRLEGGLVIAPSKKTFDFITQPPEDADLSNPRVKEYLEERREEAERSFQAAIDDIVLQG